MKKNKQYIFIGLIFFTILYLFPYFSNKNFDSKINNSVIPYFSSKIIGSENEFLTRDDISGRKVFLNFFSSWCRICVREHQALLDISKNIDIPIYGVVLKDDYFHVKKLLNLLGNPYESVIEETPILAYFLQVKSIPSLYLIDENSQVISHYTGQISSNIFHKKFDKYLKK